MNRRSVLFGAAAAGLAGRLHAEPVFRLALTPVFLDNDAVVIDRLHAALSECMQRPIELVQRRTYQDITEALLGGSLDDWAKGHVGRISMEILAPNGSVLGGTQQAMGTSSGIAAALWPVV